MVELPDMRTYCLCSELSYGDIMEKQRAEPLPFEDFLETYTKCNDGCGGCVPKLERLLVAAALFKTR
jgi:NAD(P)H-nitrite reductase large subunit